jgi:FKBP-type peptidyl-prolyl cis-trans isomerase 2
MQMFKVGDRVQYNSSKGAKYPGTIKGVTDKGFSVQYDHYVANELIHYEANVRGFTLIKPKYKHNLPSWF